LIADGADNLTGWILQSAEAVSADGLTIAGIGFDPEGNQQAWVASIPDPSSVWIVLTGLAVGRRRWVRQIFK
jgi:hypothetical protein